MSEHDEQVALFEVAKLYEARYPELALMFSIPNGGLRDVIVASRLKKEGVKAGVPDLMLPVPTTVKNKGCRCGQCPLTTDYNGLWIELKVGRNKVTEAQRWWIDELREQHYKVEVCYGWEAAWRVICEYLEIDT